jgi:SAM-dependent methyltransferase
MLLRGSMKEIASNCKNKSYDEGLGTVYERFVLNNFFDSLIDVFQIHNVLEVPIYGMTGLTGINSVQFAQRGCSVILVDPEKENVDEALDLWKTLPYSEQYYFKHHEKLSELPFPDRSFDIVWNFAALWRVEGADDLLREMARVSSKLVLIMVPNRKQLGYLFRKYFWEKDFFNIVDESWNDIKKISSILSLTGLRMIKKGVLDIPPWPDTCMPFGQLLEKLKMKKSGRNGTISRWHWDIMRYYQGDDPQLREKIKKFTLLEQTPAPWQLKAFWAHHRYVLFEKK